MPLVRRELGASESTSYYYCDGDCVRRLFYRKDICFFAQQNFLATVLSL